MSNKITDGMIVFQLKQLEANVSKPLRIQKWSPGDGWTRFQLIDDETGNYIGHVENRSNFYSSLKLANDAFYLSRIVRKQEIEA